MNEKVPDEVLEFFDSLFYIASIRSPKASLAFGNQCPICGDKKTDLNSAVACVLLKHMERRTPETRNYHTQHDDVVCWCGTRITVVNPNVVEDFKRHIKTCPAFKYGIKEKMVMESLARMGSNG